MKKSEIIKAELVYYRIDVSRPEGRKAYAELCKDLREIPFKTWVIQGSFPNGTTNFEAHKFSDSLRKQLYIPTPTTDCQIHNREINLKTDHLFEDQWSAAEGFRLHNKTLFVWPALHIKEGYYIRQNPEMIAVLQSTAKCGYCDYQAPVGEKDFCDNCISSPYLEESNLYLLRMEPIEDPVRRSGEVVKASQRAPLTEAELAVIMPRYIEAQTKNRQEKEEKLRAAIKQTYERAINITETEAKCMYWLLDEGISTENLIFYPHQNVFCFGWRNPVSKEVRAELDEKLKQFPFDFEIK